MYITFLSSMAFLTLTSKKLKYLAHPNVWALYLLDRENMNNRLGPKEGPMLSS